MDCAIDDNFSFSTPTDDKSTIAIMQEESKDAPSEDEDHEAPAEAKRQKTVDEAAALAVEMLWTSR